MNENKITDRPYIIWTLRRTGGTTLATTLAKASSHNAIQHEPFNPDRIHGEIQRNWMDSYDVGDLERQVSSVLSNLPVIKHCYELAPLQLNRALLKEASRRGYHHILLKRKSEVNRIFSLEVAQHTGAWGPKNATQMYKKLRNETIQKPALNIKRSLSHMTDCFLKTRWLISELRRSNVSKSIITFEELYEMGGAGAARFDQLLFELGHSPEYIRSLNGYILDQMNNGRQDTKQATDLFDNVAEWRATMRQNWLFLNGQSKLERKKELV